MNNARIPQRLPSPPVIVIVTMGATLPVTVATSTATEATTVKPEFSATAMVKPA